MSVMNGRNGTVRDCEVWDPFVSQGVYHTQLCSRNLSFSSGSLVEYSLNILVIINTTSSTFFLVEYKQGSPSSRLPPFLQQNIMVLIKSSHRINHHQSSYQPYPSLNRHHPRIHNFQSKRISFSIVPHHDQMHNVNATKNGPLWCDTSCAIRTVVARVHFEPRQPIMSEHSSTNVT